MEFYQKSVLNFLALLVILNNVISILGENSLEELSSSCSTDDLNHSILIESNGTKPFHHGLPSSNKEVIHISTSRDGDRFSFATSKILNYIESEEERMLNINTTLSINTEKQTKITRSLVGFGATLDGKKLVGSIKNGSFKTLMKPIIDDFLNINLLIFRIQFRVTDLINHDAERIILELESLAIEEDKSIDLILDLERLDTSLETFDALHNFALLFKSTQSVRCYSVRLNPDINNSTDYMRHLFRSNYHNETNLEELPSLLIEEKNDRSDSYTLLLRSNYSSSYSTLDYVSNRWKKGNLIAIGRERPDLRKFGDWQNAQYYAVEIMNGLKFGTNGFLEEIPVVTVLKESNSSESLIYNLRPNLCRHYLSSMFYAIAHFSLYLPAGSKVLESEISTQPNMFAAHYIAFRNPQNQTVVVVLNDNEHILPFRIVVDRKVISAYSLKPKSFNTFLIKK